MPLPDTSVKTLNSTMPGAPILNGLVGSLIDVMDACLINGFGSVTLDSLTISSGIATATVSGGHGLQMVGSTGPVIRLSGAELSELNQEWRVASVPNSATFTFVTSVISDQTATGTITAKRAPCGWSKPFAGTNKAAYLGGLQSNGHYLQVIDDSTVTTSANGRWARWRGFESMMSVDNGIGPFPTLAQSPPGLHVLKSDVSNNTARDWAMAGDDELFYFVIFSHIGSHLNQAGGFVFGKTGSLREMDAFDTLISAAASNLNTLPSYPGQYNAFSTLGTLTQTQDGRYVARAHNQLGGSVPCGFFAAPGPTSAMGSNGFAYPYAVSNGALIGSPGLSESSLIRTPALPGLYYPQHNNPFAHLDTLEQVVGVGGRTLQCFAVSSSSNQAQFLVDITGPWAR